jgi:hypothetical protein
MPDNFPLRMLGPVTRESVAPKTAFNPKGDWKALTMSACCLCSARRAVRGLADTKRMLFTPAGKPSAAVDTLALQTKEQPRCIES